MQDAATVSPGMETEGGNYAAQFCSVLTKLAASLFAVLLCRFAGTAWRARRIPARSSAPVRQCTAGIGLVDALPPELLPQVLAAGDLTATDLAQCAGACLTLLEVVRHPENDSLLWQPVCRARWAVKAYDPLVVYPAELGRLSHRERYEWAERDGLRQLGTGMDVCKVAAWVVDVGQGREYMIAPFPYRTNGEYVSLTFAGAPMRRWSVREGMRRNIVLVDGIPDVRMTRRADWGWELRNHLWVARSLAHHAQPAQRAQFEELFRDGGPCSHANAYDAVRRTWLSTA